MARGRPGERGAVSLEFALAVPVLALLMLLVLHAAVYARDALLVQGAAQHGARAAAATADNNRVRGVVRDALDGRDAVVTITPLHRQAGDTVRVGVTLRSRAGFGHHSVTARGAAIVEPGVGR